MPHRAKLIVICGPTATGKSALALAMAERLGSPLLNADSRQVYRDFNIGTAKPSRADQARWPHHLIDIADPRERFTVADYQQQAQALINTAHAQNQIPVLVGGTGLYIQSITSGLGIPSVPPQPHLRQDLTELSQSLRYAFLQQVDPQACQRIHHHDEVRTIRALEVFYTTGQPASSLQTQALPAYDIITIGLWCMMDRLRERIAQRSLQMIALGWLEEVKALRAHYGPGLPLLSTLGYAEISRYLNHELAWEDVIPLIVQNTRRFAKRQMTWFRRVDGIQWFNCDDDCLWMHVWELTAQFAQSTARLET